MATKETTPHRFILYARKSSEEKTKQARSIDSQMEELLPYAQREGLEIVTTLKEARTAKEPGRPLFGQMLKMLERGEANAVLCWHLNRLTRNEKDSGDLRWLLRSGVIQEIRTPSRIYRPEDSAFVTAVETAAGEQFIQDLIKGSHRGTMTKVRSGGVPYKAPLGYRNDRLTKEVEADPNTFPVVRRAWEQLLAGKPVAQIIEECPIRLSMSRWYVLFASEFYTGRFPYMGQTYQGRYPSMVSEREYRRALELLGKTRTVHRKKRRFAYSGLVRCGHCGHAMVADCKAKALVSGGISYHTYYACSLGAKGRCTRQGLKEEKIEEAVRQVLSEASLDPEFWELASGVARRWLEEDGLVSKRVQAQRAKSLDDALEQRRRLLRLHLEGRVDRATFDAEDRRLEGEVRVLREEQGTETLSDAPCWDVLEDHLAFGFRAAAAFDTIDVEARGDLARRMAASCTFRDGVLTLELWDWLRAVRTYAQSAAYLREEFELKKIGAHKLWEADVRTLVPVWRSLVDEVRTLTAQIPPSAQGETWPVTGSPASSSAGTGSFGA